MTHDVEVHFVERASEARPLAGDGEVSGDAVPAAIARQTPPALQDASHNGRRFLLQPAAQMNVLLHLLLVGHRGGVAPQRPRQEPRGEALRGVAALSRHGTGGQGHQDPGLQHVIGEEFVQGRTGGARAEVPHQELEPEGSQGLQVLLAGRQLSAHHHLVTLKPEASKQHGTDRERVSFLDAAASIPTPV